MTEKSIRILYVDDYPLDRALVRDALLSDKGAFELVEAASRHEFGALLMAEKYDLVLSDFNILGFTGLQVLDAVQERLPGTPVIIVTGTGSEEVAVEAIKRGAADYVIKSPHHIRRLPHIITSALEQKRLREERQQAQQELQESEQRFQLLFEEAPIGYQSLDQERCILLVNEMWIKMLGYSRDEVIGRDFHDFVTPSDKQHQLDCFAKFLADGEIRDVEFKLIRKDGSQLIANFNGVISHDDQGNFLQTHCTLNDIAERKMVEQRLMAQRKDYETIVDAMPNMIWYLDPDGRILRANKAAAEVAGLPFDELMGKTAFDLFPKQQAKKFHHDNQEVYKTKKPQLGIIEEYQTAAGENRWAHTDRLPYIDPDGTILGVIIISQDITERKQAEEQELELRTMAEALRDTAMALSSTLEFEQVLDRILDNVGRVVSADAVNLMLIEGDQVNIVRHRGYAENDRETWDHISMKISDRPNLERMRAIRQPFIINDTQNTPYWEVIEGGEWIRSYAAAPIIFEDGEVIGFLNLDHSTPQFFGPHHIERLTVFANQVAIALKNARAAEANRRYTSQLETLYQASLAFGRLESPEAIGEHILDTLQYMLDYQRGAIAVSNPATGELELLTHARMGLDDEAFRAELARLRALLKESTGVIRYVAEHGEPLRIGNIEDDPRYIEAETGIQSELTVPLQVGGKTLGAINVESTQKDAFSEEDERLLSTLAAQAAITLQNAQARDALKARSQELQLLTIRLAESEDAERRRLARELHDQVGQSLAVLRFNLNLIRDQMAQSGLDGELSSVDDSIALLDDVTQNIRGVMDDLRPSVLDDYGLFSALNWYADRFAEQTRIETRVLGKSLEPRLAANIENALFRITQEALTNVTRHAKAAQVSISLSERQGQVELVIVDDGAGFEETLPKEVGQRRGWGLINMRERAEAIGGRLSVEAVIKQGTTIKITAPRG